MKNLELFKGHLKKSTLFIYKIHIRYISNIYALSISYLYYNKFFNRMIEIEFAISSYKWSNRDVVLVLNLSTLYLYFKYVLTFMQNFILSIYKWRISDAVVVFNLSTLYLYVRSNQNMNDKIRAQRGLQNI